MSWWQPEQFEARRQILEKRAALLRAVRSFFEERGFLEVETPALQACPAMETHIHAFRTEYSDPAAEKQEFYLHTSPELAMKKLLVAGLPRIYQICHVYRNGERTRLHSPEFTMLEWYRSGADYLDIQADCVDLLRFVARTLGLERYSCKGRSCDPFADWLKISVCEAFDRYAGIRLDECLEDLPGFKRAAEETGVRVTAADGWDDVFHAVMAEKIEPYLGDAVPCILYDYPVCMAALSRRKPEDSRYAERFELYVCGVELANAFSELTDPAEQRARFLQDMEEKERLYGIRYPADEDFFRALEYGMPPSGGIALGVDRLVMLAMDAENIEQILWTGQP